MHRRAALRALAATWLVLALGACSSSDAASPDAPSTVGGVGVLPGTVAVDPTLASTVPPPSTTEPPGRSAPTTAPLVNDGSTTVGRLVDGNRVIAIGDSIMASISNRYGDQLCQQLVPRGWELEVDAEVGRFVEFGREVLAERPADDWDAAIVMLGNNYDGDDAAFTREVEALLDELEPLPVVLLNVTRFEPEQDEVNWILAVEAGRRDDVVLVDWAARTADDAPGSDELLAGDGLHLSPTGQQALAVMIGRAMGRAPSGSRGECLSSTFGDDSGRPLPDEPDEEQDGQDDDRPAGTSVATTTPVRRSVADDRDAPDVTPTSTTDGG